MNPGYSNPEVNGLAESPSANGERRTIPFDYAFRYDLTGNRENVQHETVTVSIEATFTAVSIGYGVVPKVDPIRFGLIPPSVSAAVEAPTLNADNIRDLTEFFVATPLGNIFSVLPGTVAGLSVGMVPPASLVSMVRTVGSEFFASVIKSLAETLAENLPKIGGEIGPQTADVFKNGIKINPVFLEKILITIRSGAALDPRIIAEAFQAVAAPADQIQFLYAIFDEGSGREFQSEPILNIAGLGASDGGRPFRYFAKPIVFAPQSTIRMQVTELSEFEGELHVSLQGYKTLGTPGTPTGPRQVRRTGRIRR